MASGSQNMTTYNARTVIGSNSAASPAGALLLSGEDRADDATGDTWIFLDSAGGTDTPWGIKHDQANNKIQIFGAGVNSVWTEMNTGNTYIGGSLNTGSILTVRAQDDVHEGGEIILKTATDSFSTVHIDAYDSMFRLHDGTNERFKVNISSGNTTINGNLGIGSDYAVLDGSYKLYVNGSSYFVNTITGDATSAWHILGGRPANTTNFNTHFETASNLHHDNPTRTDVELTYNRFFLSNSDQTTYGPSALHLPVVDQHVLSFGIDNGTAYSRHMAFDIRTNAVYVRARVGTWGNWEELVRNTGTWGISITGNATTATTASYANAINNDGGRRVSSEYMHADGRIRFYLATSSMTTGKPPCTGFIMKGGWDNAGGWDSMFAWGNDGHGYIRGSAGSGNSTNHTQAWRAWNTLLDSNNYTSYTVTKTGSGASGTWGISISGNAATASKVGEATSWLYFNHNNEVNFGGTNTSTTIYFGYRAVDSRGKPTDFVFGSGSGTANVKAAKVYNAVWNDYAEYRRGEIIEGGYCVAETSNGLLKKTIERLQPACHLTSDTWGTIMGETEDAKTPIAVAGRVLAYPYRSREHYHLGDALCSAPGGTVDIMTREEIREYPERIVGIVSEIPNYEIWHAGTQDGNHEIQVNDRIWIYVR